MLRYDAFEILSLFSLHPKRVHNMYIYGSRVYGTADQNSDTDLIVIANNSVVNVEHNKDGYNIHLITPDEFKKMLVSHHPGAIECLMAPEEFILLENTKFQFHLNRPSLRHSFSHVSSNSWVKCKKKLAQGDYRTGIKSLFHSLRIPMFGTQISKFGSIVDFSVANPIWDNLISRSWTWDELDSEFRASRNSILTDFRASVGK